MPTRQERPWANAFPTRSPTSSSARPCTCRCATDLVVQGQEALPAEREAVLGLELAVAQEDVDLLVEGEQLDHAQRLAVEGAQVVAGKRQRRARAQQQAVPVAVERLQGRREVRARDRKADADVSAVLVAE